MTNLKWVWATLLILGLVFFGPISFYSIVLLFAFGGVGPLAFLGLIPLAIVILLVWGLVKVFSKKENQGIKKTYKLKKPIEHMKLHNIFYIVGVVFLFVTVWYFVREYLDQFPNGLKLILLLVSIVISFVIAEFLRRADK
jgi:Na+/H+ antiporter NhaD/arsenite permease-like protein